MNDFYKDVSNKILSAMLNSEYNHSLSSEKAENIMTVLVDEGIDISTNDFKEAWIDAFNRAEDITWGKTDDQSYSTSLSPNELKALHNALSYADRCRGDCIPIDEKHFPDECCCNNPLKKNSLNLAKVVCDPKTFSYPEEALNKGDTPAKPKKHKGKTH